MYRQHESGSALERDGEAPESGVRLVWADLTRGTTASELFAEAARCRGAMRVSEWSAVPGAFPASPPPVLCVEFDQAAPSDLEPVAEIIRRNRRMPVMVLASRHCDALVLEALRIGVWDYLVKPVTWPELERRIASLLEREPDGVPARGSDPRGLRTASALAYIAERFSERVELAVAARRCHMSASHFSRVFKREHGMTFSHYVLRYRVARACELLGGARRPVKEIGFDVGFNDLAYFSRAFRRITGVCPTRYQSAAIG